jgi:AcrR family transcriptional regulator
MSVATSDERPQLARDEIIRTAMDLLGDGGIDRLTIRALGARLGVAPGAIYYYIAGKEELLEEIGAMIASSIPAPPPGPWQDQMRIHVRDALATFGRYPGADALANAAEPWRRTEGQPSHLHRILGRAGFEDRALENAVGTATIFLSGALRVADIRRRTGLNPLLESCELDMAIETLIAGLTVLVERSSPT